MKYLKQLLKWIDETDPTVEHIKDKIKLIISEEKPAKKFIPPTMKEVAYYFRDNGYQESAGIKAYNYYNSANWKDSNGKPIVNWKQKMISVWFKDINKSMDKPITMPRMNDFYSYEDYEKALKKYHESNNIQESV